MAENRLNLALRFVLEILLLVALALVGWALAPGQFRIIPTVAFPLIAAMAWGIFRVPGEGGDPIVTVSGPVRLLIEVVLFGAAIGGLFATGSAPFGIWLAGLVVLHYVLSWDRVFALVRNTPRT